MSAPLSSPGLNRRRDPSETAPLLREMSQRSAVRDEPVEALEKVDRVVYWSFWVLGAGILLSWNVLICSLPLFIALFPIDSPYRGSLASYMTTSYTFSSLIALAYAQRGVGKTSPTGRIKTSLYTLFLLTTLTAFPIIPFIIPLLPAPLLFSLLMALTVALSIATAFLQNSTLALASMWGSTEMLAVISGQGGVAVVISTVQVYFTIVAAWTEKKPHAPTDTPLIVSRGVLGAGMGLWLLVTAGVGLCLYVRRRLMQHAQYHARVALQTASAIARAVDYAQVEQEDLEALADAGEGDTDAWKRGRRERQWEMDGGGRSMKVLKKNWEVNLAVAWVFVVTLAVFPPVTTTILSVHNPVPKLLQPSVFISLHFFMFNLSDYIGRTFLPTIPTLFITSPPIILLLSLLRLIFIPLFLLCNTGSHLSTSTAPFINSDILYFLIIFVFGASNGYVSALSMITASAPALNSRIGEEEKDVAGTVAGFCLTGGLAGGSLASFGVGMLMPK